MLSIKTQQFRSFVALAEELNFRRASARLSVAQPALSRMLSSLESDLGVQLLTRTTRRVELTPAGAVFLEEARLALQHAERAVIGAREAAGGRRGTLRVGYMDFAITGNLPNIVAEFRRRYPAVRVQLQNLWTQAQIEHLVSETIDVGFSLVVSETPLIRQVIVARDKLVCVLPARHRLAGKRMIGLSQLKDEPFVIGNLERWAPYRDLVVKMCMGCGFMPRIVEEASDTMVLLGLVAADIGVTLYPDCISNLQRDGVVTVALPDALPTIDWAASWRSDYDLPLVENLLQVVRDLS